MLRDRLRVARDLLGVWKSADELGRRLPHNPPAHPFAVTELVVRRGKEVRVVLLTGGE